MENQTLWASWLSTPWALNREHLAQHAAFLAGRLASDSPARPTLEPSANGERLSAFEARRRELNAASGPVGGARSGIAVIPLFGTIVQRAGMMTPACGGTSCQQVDLALQAALKDDTIGQILIDVDSPGGSVYGVEELADQIHRATKPVVACVNSLAASAGYWLASQASEIYITPGGEAGSIGVWMAHEDWSAAMEKRGIRTTLISAGKHKVEGNPYEPLPADAKAFLQGRTEDYYNAFVKAVARGRGVPVADVRKGMGQGRVLGAQAALEARMVDGVMTITDVVKRMRRGARVANPSMAASMRYLRASDPRTVVPGSLAACRRMLDSMSRY